MATIKVFVFDLDGELRVYPPVAVLRRNDEFELVNLSEENVDWQVRAGIFGEQPLNERVNAGTKKMKRVKSEPTVASYKVTGRSSQRLARGNSDPVIIIDL